MPGSRPSPRGSAGPGPRASARRTPPGRAGKRPARGPGRRPSTPRRPATTRRTAPRPRLTGRAAVLVLVLAVLMVSYASSLRAYLQQRQQLISLQREIATSKAHIARLEREKKRWADPAFVRAETRARLGWVQPGEISFDVIGEDGRPLGQHATLPGPGAATKAEPPIWWKTAWGTMEAAGHPKERAVVPQPATRIRAPKPPATQ